MRPIVLLCILLLTTPSWAQLQCRDLFTVPKDDTSIILPEYLGINSRVEELILDGPLQDAALRLTDLFYQISDPHFISKLIHVFEQRSYHSNPEADPNSDWYVWKAQFELQNPHVNFLNADWIRMWNIRTALHDQFSDNWSSHQLAWMTAWLSKVVSPVHFRSSPRDQVVPNNQGPLVMLQNPVLRHVFKILLSDGKFKKIISDVLNQRHRLQGKLKQQLSKETVELDTSLESQVLVQMTFQILYSRYKAFIENHNYKNEPYDGLFVTDDIHRYLYDLFESPKAKDLSIHFLKHVFLGNAMPILDVELQSLLMSALQRQMRPIINEAMERTVPTADAPRPPTQPTISLTPIPLAEHAHDVIERQPYSFTMARSLNLGTQVLVFAEGSLRIFESETVEEISKFARAIQYGFTDVDGSNGLKALAVSSYYELKPGHSYYRMVVRREGNKWTVVATLHKDKVRGYVKKLAGPHPR